MSLCGLSGKAVRAQMQSCHVGLSSVWDRDSCLGMELASGTGDLWMGEAWGPAGGTGRHQPDETANPLGPIPFRQTLLSGVIYLSPNALLKNGKRVYYKHIHRKNKRRGTAQPLALLQVCKTSFFFSPSCILPGFPQLCHLVQVWERENLLHRLYRVWRQFVQGTVKPGEVAPINYLPEAVKDQGNCWDSSQNPEVYGVICLPLPGFSKVLYSGLGGL